MEKYNKTLNQAIKQYGVNAQLEMVVEECAELIQAIQKYKRNKNSTNEVVFNSIVENIIDETADVKIMITQMEKMFGKSKISERVEFKVKRL